MGKKLDKAKAFAESAVKRAGKATRKAARATGKAAGKAARATGHVAKVSGEIFAAAILGNDAERMLAIGAHDVVRDVQLAGKEGGGTRSEASPRNEGGSIPDAEVAKLLKAVGTAVWKLERRMLDEETKEPKDEFRKVWRHVEAIRDALTDIGVEVVDMTGRRYDEGLPLKVVSEEERTGLKEPEIIETLLPTIRFRQQAQIQMGEVIVGRPATPRA